MAVVAKRSTMTLFSDAKDHYSHRIRIVLAEKGVSVDIVDADASRIPAELSELNPYNSLPTLVDRELVVYETRAMMEYLDERFPHPPLLPVYPVARAEMRQFLYRVEMDWCPWVDTIVSNQNSAKVEKAKVDLSGSLLAVAPIFNERPYFMSDEFTLVDCCLAPILWRLDVLGVNILPQQSTPLISYMQRVFARKSFIASLSEWERAMQPNLLQLN